MSKLRNKWLSALIFTAAILFSATLKAAENNLYYDINRNLEFGDLIYKPATVEINRNNVNIASIIAKEPIKYKISGLFLTKNSDIFDVIASFNDGTQRIQTDAFDNNDLIFSNRDSLPIITQTETFLRLPKVPYQIKGYLYKNEKLEIIRNNQILISLKASDDLSYSFDGVLLSPKANIIEVIHHRNNSTVNKTVDKFMVYGEFTPYKAPIKQEKSQNIHQSEQPNEPVKDPITKAKPKTTDLLIQNKMPESNDNPNNYNKVPSVKQTKTVSKAKTTTKNLKKDLAELEKLKPRVKPPKKAEMNGLSEDDDIEVLPYRIKTKPKETEKEKPKPHKLETLTSDVKETKQDISSKKPDSKIYDSNKTFMRPTYDDEIIVELRVKDFVLDKIFPARENEESDIFIPLSYLSELLELAININKNQADGWIFSKNNIFRINLDEQTAANKDGTITLAKNSAFAENGEIFVEIKTLSHLMPFDLEMNWRKLSINIISGDNFPFQDKLIRHSNWKMTKIRNDLRNEKTRPKQKTEYSKFIPPSVDINSSLSWNNQRDKFLRNDNINSAGDVLYGTLNSNLSLTDNEINRIRLNYSRVDEDGGAIPIVGATQMEMGDIRISGISTFSSSAEAVGFSATNRKLGSASIFSTTTIEGDTPAGWDVELYRNGELVGFFEGSEGGHYVFDNIGMLRNGNVFEIVKYGPHGEIEKEIKNYLVPADVVPPGETRWEIAGGIGNAAIQDNREQKDKETAAWYLKLEHGINNNLIASFENERNAENSEIRTAIGATILTNKTTFRPRVLFDENNIKGMALNTMTKIGEKASLTFDGDKRFQGKDDTDEGDYNWQGKARFDTPLGKSNTHIKFTAKENLSETTETETEIGIRRRIKSTEVSQNLSYEDLSQTWKSKSTLRSSDKSYFSPNLDLNFEKQTSESLETTFKASFRKSFIENTINTLAITTPFHDMDTASISTGCSTKLKEADLGFSGSLNKQGDASISLSLRLGLGYDSEKKKYQPIKYGVSSTGWAKVKLHLEEDEQTLKPLDGVKIKGQNNVVSKEGQAFISGLSPGQSVNLSIDKNSLGDPFLTPIEEDYWVRPRAGVMESVDMIVSVTGEVEGSVLMFDVDDEQEEELSGVEVMLMETGESGRVVAKVRSEYDGYYLFDNVKPGKYLVKPNEEHIKLINAKEVDPIEITVKPGGDLVDDVKIILPKDETSSSNVDKTDHIENDASQSK